MFDAQQVATVAAQGARIEHAQDNIKALQSELNRVKEELQKALSLNEKLKERNGALEDEVRTLQSRCADLSAQIKHLEEENAGLKSSVGRLEEAQRAMKADHDEMKASHALMKNMINEVMAERDKERRRKLLECATRERASLLQPNSLSQENARL